MKIIVDGKEAVLQAGSTFEYISENPLFTEAEGYSLEITFPMKDCPQNILIFGALHVQGVDLSRITFPCDLDAGTFRKTGILTITSVSDCEVKGQFLEGMSQQNYASSLPDIYITDINYGDLDGSNGTAASIDNMIDNSIPMIVYDTTRERYIYAKEMTSAGGWSCRHLYLKTLLRWIAQKAGFKLDDSCLMGIEMYEHLVIVNTAYAGLDADGYDSFPELARMLPHWTVKQLFNEVSKFFGVMYEYDNMTSTVAFKTYAEMMSDEVSIAPLEDFDVEIQDGESYQFRGNVKYKLPDGSDPSKVNTCGWIIGEGHLYNLKSVTLEHFTDYIKIAADKSLGHTPPEDSAQSRTILRDDKTLFYLTDIKKYAVITKRVEIEREYMTDLLLCEFEIIGQFGDAGEGEEYGIAPAVLKWRRLPYLLNPDGSTSSHDDIDGYACKVAETAVPADKYVDYLNNGRVPVRDVMSEIGEGDGKEVEYYDKLWIACLTGSWTDASRYRGLGFHTRKYEPKSDDDLRAYYADETSLEDKNYTPDLMTFPYSIVPNDAAIQENADLPSVNETKLYRYKFIGNSIPSPTSVFVIRGQKFACLRITATFTPSGMSELLEGEFYPIVVQTESETPELDQLDLNLHD